MAWLADGEALLLCHVAAPAGGPRQITRLKNDAELMIETDTSATQGIPSKPCMTRTLREASAVHRFQANVNTTSTG